MKKRYRKMQRKANGKIREIKDGQVMLELPLPIAQTLTGMPQAVEQLSQEVGLMLISAVIESECVQIAGRKNARLPQRTANWWGSQLGPVYYNGQKVLLDHPRLRSKNNKEIKLSTYAAFQNPRNIQRSIMKNLLLGISSRDYKEAVEQFVTGYGIKKSSVSRHFVKATSEQMRTFLERDLSGLELCALFIDGIEFKGSLLVVALGLERTGRKHVLLVVAGGDGESGGLSESPRRPGQAGAGREAGLFVCPGRFEGLALSRGPDVWPGDRGAEMSAAQTQKRAGSASP